MRDRRVLSSVLVPILLPCLGVVALLGAPVAAQDQDPAPAAREEAARADADTQSMIRLRVDAATMESLRRSLSLDVMAHGGRGGFEVIADGDDLDSLDELKVPYDVVHPDLPAFFRSRLLDPEDIVLPPNAVGATVTPAFGAGSTGGYYTYAEVVSVLDQLRAQFPTLISAKTSIGQTIEGRDIWFVRVSDNPDVDEAEPAVRFDAMHHSREPESMQATLYFIMWCLENYGSDPLATYLVDEREIHCIPVVNPDGYVYNESTDPGGGGLWRKNRRNNGDGTFGVDLNRNYSSQWGFDDVGSSPFTSAETFRGPSAGSEPETQAMMAFISSHGFETALSIHCWQDEWLYPISYDFLLPANNADYFELGSWAMDGSDWEIGAGSFILYPANGVTTDYDHFVHDIMTATPEIGGLEDWFWPPTSRIIPLAEEFLPAMQRTALAAGAGLHPTNIIAVDLGDGDGVVEGGESAGLVLTARNTGRGAPGTSVTVTLSSGDPRMTVTSASHDFGVVAAFDGNDNAAAPLTFDLDGTVQSGDRIAYTLTVTYEGFSSDFDELLFVGQRRPFIEDDMETDVGWIAGDPGDTATTGLWELGEPVGTVNGTEPSNPDVDVTPGGGQLAWVTGNGGGSAGDDDVDGGAVTLTSPRLDLSGVNAAVLSYARWFSVQSVYDDDLVVSLSNDDGGSWTTIETVVGVQNYWIDIEDVFLDDLLPLTDAMRLRFVATDDPNNSLTEAAVDAVCIEVFDDAPRAVVYGRAGLGTPVRFNVSGRSGDQYAWLMSPFPGNLPVPGVLGDPLGVDLATMTVILVGNLPLSGLDTIELTIPNNPGFVGFTAYVQAYVKRGGLEYLTNRDEVDIEN